MKIVRSSHGSRSDGHDINSYLFYLNLTYPQKHLSSSRLRSLSWINILDPFTFYSVWALIHYITSGRDTKIPMIPLYRARYLLGARLGLTPFGPEIFWENYFSYCGRMFYGYLKAGRHASNNYIGAGFYSPVIFQIKQWDFGLRIDIWHQPKLLLSPGSFPLTEEEIPNQRLYPNSALHRIRFGGALTSIVTYHINPTLGGRAEIGAKSQGFLPGNSLWGAAIVRIGFLTVF
jgi:hypothetical protein